MKRMIFGCGYLGQRVAELRGRNGDAVHALTRRTETAERWRTKGWTAHLGDVTMAETFANLPEVDTAVWSVSWDRSSQIPQALVLDQGLENALPYLTKKCRQVIFISSTSVYGQTAGEWVDEVSPCQPGRENGQFALGLEQKLQRVFGSGTADATLMILRLSGIYGPGRLLTRAAELRAGTPLTGNPDAWLNLIHVEDAATAVSLAAERGRHPLYLISDDCPVRRADYYGHLATLVGAPPPQFAPPGTPTEASQRRSPVEGLNKRCRNTLARTELEWQPRYPTYREGLAGSVESLP